MVEVLKCVLPDVAVTRRDGLLEELELVEVEDDEVAGAEDGHQHTHAAEEERVKGPAEGPPGAQEDEDEEVDSRGQRGQHDTCKRTQQTQSQITVVYDVAQF